MTKSPDEAPKPETQGVSKSPEGITTQPTDKPIKTPRTKSDEKADKKALKAQRKRGMREYRRSIKRQYKTLQRRSIQYYIWWTIKLTFLTLLLVILAGGAFVYNKYGDIVFDAYDDAKQKIATLDMKIFTEREPTEIYDVDGNLLRTLSSHPFEYVEIDSIQDNIKLATIAIEDERYLEHDGVDFKSLVRAAYYLAKNSGEITQGGSTITQQLVKNNLLTMEQTYSRKLTEVFIAFELEKRLTKKQILEYYLNNIYFGHGAYGIESASNYYFSKASKDLTLSEATFLMAIPNNPSLYDPFERQDNTEKRQSRILQKMYEQKFITHDEFTEASMAQITLKVNERIYEPETYLVSYAISDATKKLMKVNGFKFQYSFDSDEERQTYSKHYNEVFTLHNEDIRNGGYIIETSLDQSIQTTLQENINKTMGYSTSKNKETNLYKRQAASTIIDNETGLVKAIVGGRTQQDVANTYNRAYLAYRQPGSVIKPILVYTPAIQEKGYTATTMVTDEPIEKGPRNVTNSYIGATTVEDAVVKSINTIPYRIMQKVGVDNSLKYLTDMNFARIVDSDHNPTSSIGGMTYGTTTLEMASAYSTIERNGQFLEPTSIVQIKSASNEEVLYEYQQEPKQVYDAGAAEIMRGILETTSNNANFKTGVTGKLEGYATGAKTGTTNQTKDVWYAGFTPYYTMVVWVGEDTPREMRNKTSYDDPMGIYLKTMKTIHKDKPSKLEFDTIKNATMVAWVNSRSGRISPTQTSTGKKQIIPTSRYKLQQERDILIAEERKIKQQEEERIKLIEQERKKVVALRKKKQEEDDRKALNATLKGYNTTLEKEDLLAEQVSRHLTTLRNYRFYHLDGVTKAEEYIAITQSGVNDFKYIVYKERYQEELDEQIERIATQKDLIERNIIQADHESKMQELREKDAQLKEQERQRLSKKLEQQREEERKRLEEEQREQDRLDALEEQNSSSEGNNFYPNGDDGSNPENPYNPPTDQPTNPQNPQNPQNPSDGGTSTDQPTTDGTDEQGSNSQGY